VRDLKLLPLTLIFLSFGSVGGCNKPPGTSGPGAMARDSTASLQSSSQTSLPKVAPARSCLDELLSAGARSALFRFAPDFEPFTRAQFDPAWAATDSSAEGCGLSVVRGDFNGDGTVDAATIGRGATQAYIVAIVSDKNNGYRVYWLEQPIGLSASDTLNRQIYLKLQPKHSAGITPDVSNLPFDAIMDVHPDAGVIYYWANGHFVRGVAGD
jgi:hypothetical protein